MALTPEKSRYLDVMGIPIWRLRDSGEPPVVDEPPASRAGTVADADWPALESAVSSCTLCGLHRTRTRTVFGTGNHHADWMFIGEAPGAEEDRQGLPFVGRAGQLLNEMLRALGLDREQVFIANTLKCRPPGNRDPAIEESQACAPYLQRQVALIAPRVIVCVGRVAAQVLLEQGGSLGRMRGKKFSYADTGIPVVVTYHPAYLLRNPADKPKVWQDLLAARAIVLARS